MLSNIGTMFGKPNNDNMLTNKEKQPSSYILENVSGLMFSKKGQEAPVEQVTRVLQGIPGYVVRGFMVNTSDFLLPQNRKRVYIVGVHTGKTQLRLQLDKWGLLLRTMEETSELAAHDFLLGDDTEEIQNEQSRLHNREIPKPSRGSKGMRWVEKHRQLLAKTKARPGSYQGGWTQFLSPRVKDVLSILAARTRQNTGIPADKSDRVAEISRGILYSTVSAGLSPCVTPTCRLWVFNRWRWMIGVEKLALQGFPVDRLDLSGLQEHEA